MTSVVKVNSHFRPVELMMRRRSSSVFPKQNIKVLAPCTNMRNTSRAPNNDTRNHQYDCKNSYVIILMS
ncbi:Uncharacterised protein [Segatella copri]|nr:Uncharacterised protein [Segatella copri]